MDGEQMYYFIGLAATFLLAPLLSGIINRVKAFFAGRKGPSILQLYYDLGKLLRIGTVYSSTTSGVLQLAQAITAATLAAAALFLPYAMQKSPCAFPGDILIFFYLLGTGRFALVLGALDTGSSFEGMGASREVEFSALLEGAVFAVVCFLVLSTGTVTMSELLAGYSFFGAWSAWPSLLLIVAAFFIVVLAENSRVPFDDPETHLELTMVHEAMLLDYSGPDLAVMLYCSALKLWLLSSFFTLLILPERVLTGAAGFVAYLGGVFLTAAAIGAVESSMARYRFLKVPQMLIGAMVIALVAITLLLIFGGKF